ncbi:hypothetical protein AHAS_Ahas13G0423400 [Arachis hypogaea]
MFQCDCLLSQSFTMHYIHEIPYLFTNLGSNYVDIRVKRRGNKLYFTEFAQIVLILIILIQF